jgi:hypothetical protein
MKLWYSLLIHRFTLQAPGEASQSCCDPLTQFGSYYRKNGEVSKRIKGPT